MSRDHDCPPGGAEGDRPAAYPPKPAALDGLDHWLLSSELLRHLGWIALYSLLGRRLGGIDWMQARVLHEPPDGADADELWFDYIADCGDSQKATYSVAYLCLSDLWVEDARAGAPARFIAPAHTAGDAGPQRLPRGQFLLVGGDTAYHVANHQTLLSSFRNPFCWAHADLVDKERASASRPGRLYAIPGNHDYYDALRGFNRQFRRPARGRGLLDLPGFDRVQDASYLALSLPFGWWLLGLDAQGGVLDFRQRAFFKDLIAEHAPKKIILATPEPTTVYDRRCSEDACIVETLRKIGLPAPFLEQAPRLPAGHCRLDLSGDIHHYARYWGPPRNDQAADPASAQASAQASGDARAEAEAPPASPGPSHASSSASSYASVVAGMGGAFVHHTHTDPGALEAVRRYPDADTSRRSINARLFGVIAVLVGGSVPVLGALLGVILFAAWRHDTTGPSLGRVLAGDLTGLLNGARPMFMLGVVAGAVAVASWSLRRHARALDDASGVERVGRPWPAYAAIALLGVAPFVTHLMSASGQPAPELLDSVFLFVFTVLGLGLVGAAIWHHELLDERAKQLLPLSGWDNFFSGAIAACGFASVGGALWGFGDQPASTITLHIALLLVLVLLAAGLVLNAVSAGIGSASGWAKLGAGLLGLWHALLQLGVPLLWAQHGLDWRVLLYAPLPILNYAAFWLARREPGIATKAGLVLLWLVTGGAALAIPLLSPEVLSSMGAGGLVHALRLPDAGHALPGDGTLHVLAHGLGVALLTAVASGFWFSWSLAVGVALGGFATQAGGAARIEGFKGLVRIKITRDSLTAYVIGIDQVEDHGERLAPRVVDVFTLKAAAD